MGSSNGKTSLERIADAVRLARMGGFRCVICKDTYGFAGGLVVGFKGQIVTGLCMNCSHEHAIRIQGTDEGIEIIAEKRDDSPLIVVPGSSVDEITGRAGETVDPLKPEEKTKDVDSLDDLASGAPEDE